MSKVGSKVTKVVHEQGEDSSEHRGLIENRRALRILLVDDNEDHTMLVSRLLKQRGHKVFAAHDGRQAADTLANNKFDVVALDYQLPDTTGLDILSSIKQMAGELPVVMVTASGSEKVAVSALKSGASDYVIKSPGYERELMKALEMAAESARAQVAEVALRNELELRATTDPLTGLLNRGEMEKILQKELESAVQQHRSITIALIDVDGFKGINDTFGHPVGDEVLCKIAHTLKESTRATDYVARWGGDEFAVLLPDTEFPGAKGFAQRVRRLLKESHEVKSNTQEISITLSLGIVLLRGSNVNLQSLLKTADRALYASKQSGRDRARYFMLGDGNSEDIDPQLVEEKSAINAEKENGE